MYEDFDDEDEDPNAIIDCDILEAAKENIQPLACGRRVTTLASVLKTPHQLRNAKLEATRARLRERVREAQERVDKLKLSASREKETEEENKGDDKEDKGDYSDEEQDEEEEEGITPEEAEEILLDAYVRLVTWTIEHYPRGQSAQSGILETLEEATRAMRHSEYAKVDPRYLNLWIRYGTYVDHPEVIYEFLLSNEIGTKWAKLYEEYAAILEKMNRRPKADEIYLLGIARKAEPLDHLERRHREFQKRMMVAAPTPSADSSGTNSAPTPAPPNPIPRRRPLAESSSTSTTHSASTPLTSTTSSFDVFSAAPSSSSLPSRSSSSQTMPRPNGRIPVFIDPTGEASRAPGNVWPELGTRAERIKENRLKPEKMQGAVLKPKGAAKAALREAAARARAAPKFVPYVDPEPESAVPLTSDSSGKFEVFRDPEPSVLSSDSGNPSNPLSTSNRKFEIYRDPEPPLAGTSQNGNFGVFKDPEVGAASDTGKPFKVFKDPEALVPVASSGRAFEVYVDPEPGAVVPSSNNNAKFVPYVDPEPQSTASDSCSGPNIAPYKDPKAPVAPVGSRKSKTKFLQEVGPTPRRSARLNPKLAAKEEPQPKPVPEEMDKDAEVNTSAKPAIPACFVPFQDEDASQRPAATSSAQGTAMRPKVLGLGVGKAASEAEALRKNPFKNYKDI
ncbi:BUB1_1 [Sanghuangporus sanghuang]